MSIIKHNIPLAPLTTIQLGGRARHYAFCQSIDEVREAIRHATEQSLKFYVLGGGSNTIFPDQDYDGLVVHVGLKGLAYTDANQNTTLAAVGAGEVWDNFVLESIQRGLSGIECLSGIPGYAGATPIQNVGAYGQEVSETIERVVTLDTQTLQTVSFSNKECLFEYRGSRFKYKEQGRYIITEITYRLRQAGELSLRYPELKRVFSQQHEEETYLATPKSLQTLRQTVLHLRKKKSMLVDPADPHAKSCGSFFLNPHLSVQEFQNLQKKIKVDIPHFPSGGSIKIPAGWLIEQAGFSKGTHRGRVGISKNHTLALVNYGGTTEELLALAQDIRQHVQKKFGIFLMPEPCIVK